MLCLLDSQLPERKHGGFRSLVCGNDRHPVRRAVRADRCVSPVRDKSRLLVNARTGLTMRRWMTCHQYSH